MTDIISTYYKARMTILDMFVDRGYTYNGSKDLNPLRVAIESFRDLYLKGDINIKGLLTADNRPVYVKFIPKDEITARSGASILKVQFKEIAQYFGIVLSDSIAEWTWAKDYKIIMVYNLESKDLYQETMFEKNFSHLMEIFPIKRLTFNIIKHRHQPKFTLLTQRDPEYKDIIRINGAELDNAKTLRDQGIKNNSKLFVYDE